VISDSISMAFLVVLESLSPAERAVLLLHDVFRYSHAEVAAMLDRSEAASRQLLRSARSRIAAERRKHPVARDEHELLVRRFRAACEGGSMEDFVSVLTEDATFVSDGGATVKAARRPIVGATRIARFLAKTLSRELTPVERRVVTLNGQPALALVNAGTLTSLVFVEGSAQAGITQLRFLRNPAKLAGARDLLLPPGAVPVPGDTDAT
jgi:RNA polymerase sigma-70 factor (ECF subfamily)